MSNGFPEEGYRFLVELKLNNDRDWFTAHKKEYEKFVKKPAEELADEVAEAVGREFGDEFGVKIYRIHRDVRFSKDKTPYNPYVRMTLMPVSKVEEKKGCDRPGLHFSIETDEVIAGCGMFGFEGEMLTRFRQVVDSKDGEELAEIIGKLVGQGGRMDEPELKKVPAGFESDHPRGDLLRRKGLALWFHEPKWHEAGVLVRAEDVAGLFARSKPLYDWMQRLV